MYFDTDYFIDLENELGNTVELCESIADVAPTNIDYELGVTKRQTRYRVTELQGYATRDKYSEVSINGGSSAQTAKYNIILNTCTFSPEMLTPQSLIGVKGRYYQIELTNPMYHQGQIIYYRGVLTETDRTIPKIAIAERVSLRRMGWQT